MDPYRIAVCEDDTTVGACLVQRCEQIFNDWKRPVDIKMFSTADDLQQSLEEDLAAFDLFLLDIKMAGTNGLDLARWLYHAGVRDKVVFITAYADYAVEGYEVHPLHYLLKPVSKEALEDVLRLALEHHHPKKILLQRGSKLVSLLLEDIHCLESRNHGVIVHTTTGEQIFSMSLGEIAKRMPPDAFAHCHKSYLVNLDWVKEIGRTEVILRDDEHLPVSRTFYQSFQSAFIRHLNHTHKK